MPRSQWVLLTAGEWSAAPPFPVPVAMEPAWRHPARGRGRGDRGQRSRPPQMKREPPGAQRAGDRSQTQTSQSAMSSESRFEEIRKSNLVAAQRLAKSGFSSSSDEDEDDEDVESKEGKKGQILRSTFTSYNQQTGGDSSGLQRTGQYLNELFQSGALTCLICIGSVKRTQPVWSCSGCFSLFHLPCVQKWARDSVFLVSSVTDDDFGQKQLPWPCPKCRAEYPQSATPNRYLCYCGKVQDPPCDPWLVPHSCGSVCEKRLKPDCGHSCLLLCHPGPCPPCPKMVSVSCSCGKAKPLPRRCSSKPWSCQQVCGRLLLCKQHACSQLCHSECPPCPRVGEQSCVCGRERKLTPCADPQWNCSQVCGRSLTCGNHTCEDVCHSAPCPPCPRAVNRTCPCGKTKSTAGCAEDVPPCGDTCERPLTCGKHTCSRRCHRGSCDTCRQEVEKECRCGKHRRMMPCHKEYLCDSKCGKTRSCSRHQCRRKCCPGECPPCDLNCGRTLGCRNHKCPSICHQGACYPCPETVDVSCSCGKTVLSVPCGRERSTKPPRCKEPCRRPADCHHPSLQRHRCHPGPCPPCSLPCEHPLQGCEHLCPQPCHDRVLMPSQQAPLAGPWEQPTKPAFERKALPCAPCQVPIPTSCFGEHEVSPVPCHRRGPFSCGRLCGRPLTCTNHSCSRACHRVAPDDKCDECGLGCSRLRPPGCPHPCPRACHGGLCPPCGQTLRLRCHCKISLLYVSCLEVTSADDETKTRLSSCSNQCPRELPCGHRCRLECHPGACESKCVTKVKLRCPCRRIKKEVTCHLSPQSQLQCDDRCLDQQRKESQLKEAEQKAAQEEELRKQQEELEAFERRLKGAGRRNKRRRRGEESDDEGRGLWSRRGLYILLISLGGVLLAAAYFYLTQ